MKGEGSHRKAMGVRWDKVLPAHELSMFPSPLMELPTVTGCTNLGSCSVKETLPWSTRAGARQGLLEHHQRKPHVKWPGFVFEHRALSILGTADNFCFLAWFWPFSITCRQHHDLASDVPAVSEDCHGLSCLLISSVMRINKAGHCPTTSTKSGHTESQLSAYSTLPCLPRLNLRE